MESPLSASAERVNSSHNAQLNQRRIPLSRSARIQSGDFLLRSASYGGQAVTALHISYVRSSFKGEDCLLFPGRLTVASDQGDLFFGSSGEILDSSGAAFGVVRSDIDRL